MSRRINVNPAHYKVAGRERQGEDIVQSAQKQAFGKQQAVEQRWQAQHGGAPWETTPPAPLVDTPEERRRAEQAERRAATRAKKSAKKSGSKKSRAVKDGRKAASVSKTSRKAKPVKPVKKSKKAASRATSKTAKKVSAKRRSSRG